MQGIHVRSIFYSRQDKDSNISYRLANNATTGLEHPENEND